MQFNTIQQEIISLQTGTHIVQAPAGCGKTAVLTERVKQTLQSGKNPSEMICLTFTNRAANEMKERIDSKTVFIGNLHNFCTAFLKENNQFKLNATILDEGDYKEILAGIIKKNKVVCEKEKGTLPPFDNGMVYKYITEHTRVLSGLNSTEPDFYFNQHPDLSDFFQRVTIAYLKVKNEFSFIDFDDLLCQTMVVLKSGGQLKMSQYDWIQIDEVQDLNAAQWEIIEAISSKASCRIYFGDYDQSIYSFMGADQSRFLKILENYPKHYLNENYRSSTKIKELLNVYLNKTLQSKQQFDVEKEPSNSEESEFVLYKQEGFDTDEIETLVGNHLKQKSLEDEVSAVLVKSNFQADLLSEQLKLLGIPHYMLSGQDFFEYEDVKNGIAVLRSLQNPFDLISWSRLVRRFSSGLTVEQARSFINKGYRSGFIPSDFFKNNVESTLEVFKASISTNRIVVFDTETTSLDTDVAEIIQIAAVEIINGEKGQEFEVYIKTDTDLTESFEIHHISNEFLNEKGIESSEALQKFADFIGTDSLVLAHNLDYDKAVLLSFANRNSSIEFKSLLMDGLDSLTVSRLLFPNEKSHKLGDLLDRFGLEGVNSHNALDDVRATVYLVQFLHSSLFDVEMKASSFREEYGNLLKTFNRNFGQIFTDLSKKYNSDFKLSDWFYWFCRQSFQQLDPSDPRLESVSRIMDQRQDESESLRIHLQKNLMYYTGLKEADLMDDSRKIVVATIHKSKGLAFDSVYMPALVNYQFPHYFDQTPEQVLEAKRLFYVAMSRAKKNIYLSYHTARQMRNGQTMKVSVSPFLNDIKSFFKEENL